MRYLEDLRLVFGLWLSYILLQNHLSVFLSSKRLEDEKDYWFADGGGVDGVKFLPISKPHQ